MKQSNIVKGINIKNHTYYFFDDIVNIQEIDPNNIKIDEKSYKNIGVYYIAHVTIKDLKCVKINSAKVFIPYSQQNEWILWRN